MSSRAKLQAQISRESRRTASFRKAQTVDNIEGAQDKFKAPGT